MMGLSPRFSDLDFTRVNLLLDLYNCGRHRYNSCHNYRYIENTHFTQLSSKSKDYIQHLANIRPKHTKTIPTQISLTFITTDVLGQLESIKGVIRDLDKPNIVYYVRINSKIDISEYIEIFNQLKLHVIVEIDSQDFKFENYQDLDFVEFELIINSQTQSIFDIICFIPKEYNIIFDFQYKDLKGFDLDQWYKTCATLCSFHYSQYNPQDPLQAYRKSAEFKFITWTKNTLGMYFATGINLSYPPCHMCLNQITLDCDGNVWNCCHGGEKTSVDLNSKDYNVHEDTINWFRHSRGAELDCPFHYHDILNKIKSIWYNLFIQTENSIELKYQDKLLGL